MLKTLLTLLFFFVFAQGVYADSLVDPLQSHVLSILHKVEQEERFMGTCNPDSLVQLPFGIVKEINETRYIIAIDSATFLPGQAKFSAFAALELPGSTQRICFAARNIAFNPQGVIPSPATRLYLVSEHRIRLSNAIQLVLKPDNQNFVEWDCNGFQAVSLKGHFEFNPGMIYPANPNDSIVRASMQVYVNDLHNLVVQASLPAFKIRGVDGFIFNIQDATADFSEILNAPGMMFPVGYNLSPYGNQVQQWTGFYLRTLSVTLPPQFNRNGQPPTISAQHLLIDDSGVTGLFSATNLFTMSQGDMSGWGFSVNTIQVGLSSNQLNGAGFGGYLRVPVSDSDSLQYSASMIINPTTHQTEYQINISPTPQFKTDVLCGTLHLYSNSALSIQVVNNKFRPQATLHGKYTLNHSAAAIKELPFQNVLVTTQAPYLMGGTFGLVGNPDSTKLSGFRITISSLALVATTQLKPMLQVGVNVNLGDTASMSLGVNGTFFVTTDTTGENVAGIGRRTKLKFNGIQVNQIGVQYQSGPVKLSGAIQFLQNHLVYGNGFNGQLQMSFKPLDAPITASCWFGNTSGYRYFYVDAAVPITIPMGHVAIYRFMGGVYYHMSRPPGSTLESQLYTPAFGNAAQYIPNANVGLGVKAGVTLGTHTVSSGCNGDVSLELSFNANGGLNFIQMQGDVFFMVDINDRITKSPSQIPVRASAILNYDFNNEAFHAVAGFTMQLPGVTSNGNLTMHFEPGLWYVWIGRPAQRVNVNLAGIATLNSYCQFGTQIDPMPNPPSNVMNIVQSAGLMNTRQLNALSTGSGAAFGASLQFGSNGTFGANNFNVYYNIGAGAGFDVMVLRYGPNTICQNSNDPIGFRGWYGQGQIYAWLTGAVGLSGEVSGQNFNVTILSLSAAALLQAQLPNPSWMGGIVACDYDILGGLVSGHVDVSFQAGNQCNIVQQ